MTLFRTFFDRPKRQVSDIIRGRFDSVRYNQGKFMTENVPRKKPPVNNGSTIGIFLLNRVLNPQFKVRVK